MSIRVLHSQRPLWLRSFAMLSVLFLLLASARGLMPEICMNLSAAAPYASERTQAQLAPVHSCCTMPGAKRVASGKAPHPANRTPLPPLKDCPFCNIVSTPAEALQMVSFPPPVDGVDGQPGLGQTAPLLDATPLQLALRGPPLSPLSAA